MFSFLNNIKYFISIFRLSSFKSCVWLAIAVGIVLLSVACNICAPYVLKSIVDEFAYKTYSLNTIPISFIKYALLIAIGKIVIELKYIPYSLWENTILPKMYVNFYDKSIKTSFDYLKKNNSGEITSKINLAVMGFKNFFFDSIFYFMPLLIELICISSSVMLLFDDICLGLTIFFGFSIYTVLTIYFSHKITKQQNVARETGLKLTRILSDLFESWKDIKLCSGFILTKRMVSDSASVYANQIHNVYAKRLLVGVCQSSILLITIVISNYLTLKSMSANAISIGSIVLINSYLYQIMRPLESLGMNYRNLIRFSNDFILFEKEIDKATVIEETNITNNIKKITLKNVSKPGLFKPFNFEMLKGEAIVILGKSGAGKTSLINIIANLDKDYQGNVYYDQVNITKAVWVNKFPFAYLASDSKLLRQSLKQNLKLSDECNDDEMGLYLNNVSIGKDFYKQGSLVLNDEMDISNGERQRVLIARTLAMNKEIRIFDESLSALDHKMQIKIVDAMLMNSNNYFTILVTHNEALASKFNRILRVVDGNIVEESMNITQCIEV